MRSCEVLLSVANLVALGALAIPALRAIPGTGYLALIPLLIAGLQVAAEGARWPMIPAYTLAVLLFLAGLLQLARPAGLPVPAGVGGVGTGLGIVGGLLAIALPLAFPIFRIPRPSGPNAIGTVTYHWVDAGRRELFRADPDARRELMVQVWYPAQEGSSTARAPYVDHASTLSPALARLRHLPGGIFDYWSAVPTHASPSAPVATTNLRYPLLIFLTGLNGFRQSNTLQVEELVSHGYIVVGIDQPYAAAVVRFPDGRQITGWSKDQIQPLYEQSLSPSSHPPRLNGQVLPEGILPYFAQDVRFTLDQLAALDTDDPQGILTARFDQQRVGIFGISLGAMIAAEACDRDPRVRACLMMDAAMPASVARAGLRQPSLWMTRDVDTIRLERQRSGGWTEKEIAQTLNTMRAAFNQSSPGPAYYLQIAGIFHIDFTDAPAWSPLMPWLGISGPLGASRGLAILNAYTLAFFEQTLGGRPAPLLDGRSSPYPEVTLEKR